MRWKQIKEDVTRAPAPAGWAEVLDRGIDDVDQGRVTPVSDVIRELDATLADMAAGTTLFRHAAAPPTPR